MATTHDRIHLKTTHHAFAKHLEDCGDVGRAMRHFHDADTHRTEVPRMLFDHKKLGELEEYVARHEDDAQLVKWWAQYLESQGHFDKAQRFYARAKDAFALVRIACFNRDVRRAKAIVADASPTFIPPLSPATPAAATAGGGSGGAGGSGSGESGVGGVRESGSSGGGGGADSNRVEAVVGQQAAAAYFLARYLEGQSEIQDAIGYYAVARCFNHAIRLGKAFGLESDLMSHALQVNGDKIE